VVIVEIGARPSANSTRMSTFLTSLFFLSCSKQRLAYVSWREIREFGIEPPSKGHERWFLFCLDPWTTQKHDASFTLDRDFIWFANWYEWMVFLDVDWVAFPNTCLGRSDKTENVFNFNFHDSYDYNEPLSNRWRSWSFILYTNYDKRQYCGSGSAFILVGWIRIRIHIGRLDPDPHWEYRSGSGPKRAKMNHKSEENPSF
jgi:hypothetical protein